MLITKPNEIGLVKCTDFMESTDLKRIWFSISAESNIFTGSEVPTYYSDWYSNMSITKVNIKSYNFTDVNYDIDTKMLSFTCTANVEVYVTGQEAVAVTPTVIYTFNNL